MKIFIALGTHKQQFNRLLKAMDKIAGSKAIDAKIFAQIGNSDYEPKHFPFARFLRPDEYEKEIKNADVVISHAGAGSIITALQYRKPLIIVPRLKKFGEHTDDHQIDLAKALDERKKAIAVFNPDELLDAIKKAKDFKPKTESDKEKLIARIKGFLEECSCKKRN